MKGPHMPSEVATAPLSVAGTQIPPPLWLSSWALFLRIVDSSSKPMKQGWRSPHERQLYAGQLAGQSACTALFNADTLLKLCYSQLHHTNEEAEASRGCHLPRGTHKWCT